MYYSKYYRMLSEDNIVLVYQMGKVGSSSITSSLEKIDIKSLHIHSLYKNRGYALFKKFLLAKKYYFLYKRILLSVFYLWQRLKLHKHKNLKIITLVREPISVNISSFFHNLSYFAYEFEQNATSSIAESFFEKFNNDYTLDWFDTEWFPTIGVDVYKYDFNKEAGYSIIKEKNIECLIIKLEKLDELEAVIADFVGNDQFKLLNSNISTEKWYNSVYQDFKNNVKLSPEFIDRMYSSKLVQHFYSSKEIDGFRSKYLKSK